MEYEYWREAIINAFNILNLMDEMDINKSTAYDVEHKGKHYPPKEVFRLAADFIEENYPKIVIPKPSGGKSTNKFIEKFGFKVIEKEKIKMIEKIKTLIETPHFQDLLASETFYFSELSKLFNQYKDFDIELIKTDLESYLNNEPKDFNFQELLDSSTGDFNSFLFLIGKLISLFDEKGYKKKAWNPYQDKRVVSRSMLSQKYWTGNLLKYKLLDFRDDYLQEEAAEAFKHSINFINQPEQHVNIVSKNHRKDIVNYFNLGSASEIINLFSNELKDLKSELNRGVIISHLLYNSELKKIWMSSIVGLMASDSTGWFENYLKESNKHNYSIVWNSKKPSGTNATLKVLRSVITEEGSFNLYYTSNNKINYVAKIIDFAENNQDYINKNWKKSHKNIFGFNNSFSEYNDGNKKASIVFLCESFNKIKPINKNDFEIFKTYSYPTQDNLTPLQSEPEIDIIKTMSKINYIDKNENQMEENYNAPLNQIFYGPPGTGKTYNTILEAAKIITQDETITYTDSQITFNEHLGKQIEFITFHQNYSYEDFIQGLRPDTESNGELSFFKSDGVFKKIADRALKNFKESNTEVQKKKSFTEVFEDFVFPLIEGDIDEIEIKMKKVSFYITNIKDKSIEFRKMSGGTDHTLRIGTLREMYEEESTKDIQGLSSYYRPLLTELLKIGKLEETERIIKKNYVIIIDEINRANISRVFGELITLIEKDKRYGGNIPLTATLPSGEPFIVPSNLYIIGTMNTADKSIALLDIALRRRFEFKAMYPKYEIENKTIYKSEFLKSLNGLIVKSGKGHDFTIGHAYFMCDDNETFDFESTINNKVIPLLLEYYMNDDQEVKKILDEALKEQGLKVDNWPLEVIRNG
ncbi:AAA family ATPase [Lacinutrix neustonica]|uniref:AAA family ATPase n=1 Tax=Lacinutrix neustonica TaxID=2980107 RepID=A0A9E8MXU9_9FLAO|nr:AAA family ATPase [Lacinutrix neustonica]WAC02264.1 AAA family ATPase [Lacinutrix neustonica]